MGDGNGWVRCACGRKHWGLHGAAGLLVTSGDRVLLQHRSRWTHNGGTWALPGGARDSHESPHTAALREAREETSLDVAALVPYAELVDEHGPWSYTTIVAHTPHDSPVRAVNDESDDVRWWPTDAVEGLTLHYGFAAAWPRLRALIETAPTASIGRDEPASGAP